MRQGTADWTGERLGLFTASEVHKLMGKSITTDTALTYILERLAERMTGVPVKEATGPAIMWGQEYQLEAIEYYEKATGDLITGQPFYRHNALPFGASPDGFISGKNIGIEIKCPFNSTNHLNYLLCKSAADLKDEKAEYYWQIMAGLCVTGWQQWHFVSYDPRMKGRYKMKILTIERNEDDINLLIKRVSEAETKLKEFEAKV